MDLPFYEMVRKMASYGRELDISILKMVDMFDVDVAEADQLDVWELASVYHDP